VEIPPNKAETMKFKIHTFFAIFVILFSSALGAEENILGNWSRIFSVLEWKKSAEQTILAIQQQDYEQALKWGKKTYDYARQYFDDDYQDILSISIKLRASTLNLKLGESYLKGDYQTALELAKQLHQFTTQHLGNEPEFTLVSLTLLATMYGAQGDFKKAKHWLIQAQSLSQKIGTENHLSRVYIPNDLGNLYEHQGDYGNAEYYYNQALQMGKQIKIESHYICLILNRLGSLYLLQDRYQEAEAAYQEAYSLRDQIPPDIFPPQDQDGFSIKMFVDAKQSQNTIEALWGLAAIAKHKQHYGQAKRWLEQALSISKQQLGEKNIYTIQTIENLASLYASQDLYQEAEKLLNQLKMLQTEVLGAEHPHTLATQLRLAKWYYYQGHYQAAAALYEKTLPRQERLLGSEHPDIWLDYLNYASCLVNLNRHKESVNLLKMMEPIQLFYAKGQFYTTGKERVRRALFSNLAASFQSMALTLANRYPSDPEITRLAANMLLRWKQLQAEEEAIMAKVAANNQPLADLTQ
jgi:tetratricopeptide (TPR) repeat protein